MFGFTTLVLRQTFRLNMPLNASERLGYVCNPRSLKEGTETSRRRTDELGSRLERPIHFECKLNEPMHIGMRLLHPAAADHSVSINRQQVQHIFRFSLRSRAGARPLSGGTGPWRRDVTSPFPPSGNEGYIRNRDVPYQSVTLDVTSEDRRIGIPTKRPRILPLPVSRGGLLCRYFLAQVRAPIGRSVTVALALPTQ